MEHAVTTLTSHNPRSVNTKEGPKTVHSFGGADGRDYEAWEGPLADRLYAFYVDKATIQIGFDVKIRQGQNGQFVNNTVKQVALHDASAPAQGTLTAPTASSAPSAPTAPAAPAASHAGSDYMKQRHPDEALQIMRQSALDKAIATSACGLVTGLSFEGLIKLAQRYVDFFQYGDTYVLEQAAQARQTLAEAGDVDPDEEIPTDQEELGPQDDIGF